MDNIIDVDTGKLVVSAEPVILRALALGSCVAFILYNSVNHVGGLAHIMLPGSAPISEKLKSKYSKNAFNKIVQSMKSNCSNEKELKAFIIGGANVLEEDNRIGELVVEDIKKNIIEMGLSLVAEETGGRKRRSAVIDIERGIISFTKGDSKSRILWSNKKNVN